MKPSILLCTATSVLGLITNVHSQSEHRGETCMTKEFQSIRNIACTATIVVAAMTYFAPNALAATHYVSQSSPSPTPPYSTLATAAHTIQEAVDVAGDGDTVLVEPGDYALANQVVVTNAIRLQGASGASQTFLSSQDNVWCLRMSNSLAVADGLTFRPIGRYDEGFGAFVVGGMIQNCNFTNFRVGFPGGAIAMIGGVVSNSIVTYRRYPTEGVAVYGDGALVTDCLVSGIQSFAGGTGVSLTNSRLQNSVISGVSQGGNFSGGPAVLAQSSSVVGCTISNNFNLGSGGGAYLQDSFMDRCIVTGNTGTGECLGSGGGGIFETNSVIRNSLITSNSLTFNSGDPICGNFGGGVYMRDGSLVNCTVVGNTARVISNGTGGGGGVFAESGGITNCIIYLNLVYAANNPSSNWVSMPAAVFDHCCTTPDPGGAGNTTQDPQFVNATIGDFHLAATSPCIDAGITQPWMIGAQDLDGNPRVSGASVDIGAYEKPAATAQDLVSALITDVNSLIADGTLAHGHGNALLTGLRAAVKSLNRGSTGATCGQVGAFITKVQAFINQGELSEAEGQSLISTAEDLRTALGCGSR
jgi:hypothetical protein